MKKGESKKVSSQTNKKKIKSLPVKEKDYTAIILEEMRSNFKIFGEALGGVTERLDRVEKKGDATFEEVGKMQIKMSEMSEDISEMKVEIAEVKEDIVEIKKDIVEIKEDVVEIKKDISDIKVEIAEMKVEIAEMKEDISGIKGELKGVSIRLDNIEFEVKSLRRDFDLAKEDLKKKAGVSYVSQFEERLVKVEKCLETQSK